jgi:hypothetical protein
MVIHSALKVVGRISGSLGLAFGLFIASMAIPLGITRLPWLLPGKFIAPIIASALPQAWVMGDPAAENHWHVVSGGGFVVLCGLLFWAAVIFAVWQWRSSRPSPKGSAGV